MAWTLNPDVHATTMGRGQHDGEGGQVTLCRHHCGLPVAEGLDTYGRPHSTCCQGCGQGGAHDWTCQLPPHVVAALSLEGPASPMQPIPGTVPIESDAILASRLQQQEEQEALDMEMMWATQHRNPLDGCLQVYDPVWGEITFKRIDDTDPRAEARRRQQIMAASVAQCCPSMMHTLGCFGSEVQAGLSEEDVARAWLRIFLSCSMMLCIAQVLVFIGSVSLYGGFVPLSLNPMLGPHPSALDYMGARNSARILDQDHWHRLLFPLFLHSGFFHLLCNIAVQLRTGLILETLFGCRNWLILYFVSGVYALLASALVMPHALSVGASGALCGLMGAWPVFIAITWNQTSPKDRQTRNRQFKIVLCSVLLMMLLSFIPMVDFAAHLGGLAAGASLAAAMFAGRLQTILYARICFAAGGLSFGMLFIVTLVLFLTMTEPDEALLDTCMPPGTASFLRDAWPEAITCTD